MNKSMIRFLVILAVVLIVFVVIAFVIPFAHTGVFWVALVFGLIAIAAQLYVQPKAFAGEGARSKFYGFPIGRVGVIYLIAQLVLSLAAMALSAVLVAACAEYVFFAVFYENVVARRAVFSLLILGCAVLLIAHKVYSEKL